MAHQASRFKSMPAPTHHVRPLPVAAAQTSIRWFFRILTALVFRVRVHGLEHYPESGPCLICSNHQSFLDPIILGVVCPRPVNYMARKSLFRFAPLARFMTFNDAFSIDREATGLDGIRECLKRLKRGETVVMFPEGTRTPDGNLQPVQPGFSLMARRTRACLLPVAIEGCFQAYSRHATLPRGGRVHVVIGRPIEFPEYQNLTEAEACQLVQDRLAECFSEAQRRWKADALPVRFRQRRAGVRVPAPR